MNTSISLRSLSNSVRQMIPVLGRNCVHCHGGKVRLTMLVSSGGRRVFLDTTRSMGAFTPVCCACQPIVESSYVSTQHRSAIASPALLSSIIACNTLPDGSNTVDAVFEFLPAEVKQAMRTQGYHPGAFDWVTRFDTFVDYHPGTVCIVGVILCLIVVYCYFLHLLLFGLAMIPLFLGVTRYALPRIHEKVLEVSHSVKLVLAFIGVIFAAFVAHYVITSYNEKRAKKKKEFKNQALADWTKFARGILTLLVFPLGMSGFSVAAHKLKMFSQLLSGVTDIASSFPKIFTNLPAMRGAEEFFEHIGEYVPVHVEHQCTVCNKTASEHWCRLVSVDPDITKFEGPGKLSKCGCGSSLSAHFCEHGQPPNGSEFIVVSAEEVVYRRTTANHDQAFASHYHREGFIKITSDATESALSWIRTHQTYVVLGLVFVSFVAYVFYKWYAKKSDPSVSEMALVVIPESKSKKHKGVSRGDRETALLNEEDVAPRTHTRVSVNNNNSSSSQEQRNRNFDEMADRKERSNALKRAVNQRLGDLGFHVVPEKDSRIVKWGSHIPASRFDPANILDYDFLKVRVGGMQADLNRAWFLRHPDAWRKFVEACQDLNVSPVIEDTDHEWHIVQCSHESAEVTIQEEIIVSRLGELGIVLTESEVQSMSNLPPAKVKQIVNKIMLDKVEKANGIIDNESEAVPEARKDALLFLDVPAEKVQNESVCKDVLEHNLSPENKKNAFIPQSASLEEDDLPSSIRRAILRKRVQHQALIGRTPLYTHRLYKSVKLFYNRRYKTMSGLFRVRWKGATYYLTVAHGICDKPLIVREPCKDEDVETVTELGKPHIVTVNCERDFAVLSFSCDIPALDAYEEDRYNGLAFLLNPNTTGGIKAGSAFLLNGHLVYSIPTDDGDSGCPIVTATGRVLGIHRGSTGQFNVGVPLCDVFHHLEKKPSGRIDYGNSPGIHHQSREYPNSPLQITGSSTTPVVDVNNNNTLRFGTTVPFSVFVNPHATTEPFRVGNHVSEYCDFVQHAMSEEIVRHGESIVPDYEMPEVDATFKSMTLPDADDNSSVCVVHCKVFFPKSFQRLVIELKLADVISDANYEFILPDFVSAVSLATWYIGKPYAQYTDDENFEFGVDISCVSDLGKRVSCYISHKNWNKLMHMLNGNRMCTCCQEEKTRGDFILCTHCRMEICFTCCHKHLHEKGVLISFERFMRAVTKRPSTAVRGCEVCEQPTISGDFTECVICNSTHCAVCVEHHMYPANTNNNSSSTTTASFCPVCQENIAPGEVAIFDSCVHNMCGTCAAMYFNMTSKRCPVCREPVHAYHVGSETFATGARLEQEMTWDQVAHGLGVNLSDLVASQYGQQTVVAQSDFQPQPPPQNPAPFGVPFVVQQQEEPYNDDSEGEADYDDEDNYNYLVRNELSVSYGSTSFDFTVSDEERQILTVIGDRYVPYTVTLGNTNRMAFTREGIAILAMYIRRYIVEHGPQSARDFGALNTGPLPSDIFTAVTAPVPGQIFDHAAEARIAARDQARLATLQAVQQSVHDMLHESYSTLVLRVVRQMQRQVELVFNRIDANFDVNIQRVLQNRFRTAAYLACSAVLICASGNPFVSICITAPVIEEIVQAAFEKTSYGLPRAANHRYLLGWFEFCSRIISLSAIGGAPMWISIVACYPTCDMHMSKSDMTYSGIQAVCYENMHWSVRVVTHGVNNLLAYGMIYTSGLFFFPMLAFRVSLSLGWWGTLCDRVRRALPYRMVTAADEFVDFQAAFLAINPATMGLSGLLELSFEGTRVVVRGSAVLSMRAVQRLGQLVQRMIAEIDGFAEYLARQHNRIQHSTNGNGYQEPSADDVCTFVLPTSAGLCLFEVIIRKYCVKLSKFCDQGFCDHVLLYSMKQWNRIMHSLNGNHKWNFDYLPDHIRKNYLISNVVPYGFEPCLGDRGEVVGQMKYYSKDYGRHFENPMYLNNAKKFALPIDFDHMMAVPTIETIRKDFAKNTLTLKHNRDKDLYGYSAHMLEQHIKKLLPGGYKQKSHEEIVKDLNLKSATGIIGIPNNAELLSKYPDLMPKFVEAVMRGDNPSALILAAGKEEIRDEERIYADKHRSFHSVPKTVYYLQQRFLGNAFDRLSEIPWFYTRMFLGTSPYYGEWNEINWEVFRKYVKAITGIDFPKWDSRVMGVDQYTVLLIFFSLCVDKEGWPQFMSWCEDNLFTQSFCGVPLTQWILEIVRVWDIMHSGHFWTFIMNCFVNLLRHCYSMSHMFMIVHNRLPTYDEIFQDSCPIVGGDDFTMAEVPSMSDYCQGTKDFGFPVEEYEVATDDVGINFMGCRSKNLSGCYFPVPNLGKLVANLALYRKGQSMGDYLQKCDSICLLTAVTYPDFCVKVMAYRDFLAMTYASEPSVQDVVGGFCDMQKALGLHMYVNESGGYGHWLALMWNKIMHSTNGNYQVLGLNLYELDKNKDQCKHNQFSFVSPVVSEKTSRSQSTKFVLFVSKSVYPYKMPRQPKKVATVLKKEAQILKKEANAIRRPFRVQKRARNPLAPAGGVRKRVSVQVRPKQKVRALIRSKISSREQSIAAAICLPAEFAPIRYEDEFTDTPTAVANPLSFDDAPWDLAEDAAESTLPASTMLIMAFRDICRNTIRSFKKCSAKYTFSGMNQYEDIAPAPIWSIQYSPTAFFGVENAQVDSLGAYGKIPLLMPYASPDLTQQLPHSTLWLAGSTHHESVGRYYWFDVGAVLLVKVFTQAVGITQFPEGQLSLDLCDAQGIHKGHQISTAVTFNNGVQTNLSITVEESGYYSCWIVAGAKENGATGIVWRVDEFTATYTNCEVMGHQPVKNFDRNFGVVEDCKVLSNSILYSNTANKLDKNGATYGVQVPAGKAWWDFYNDLPIAEVSKLGNIVQQGLAEKGAYMYLRPTKLDDFQPKLDFAVRNGVLLDSFYKIDPDLTPSYILLAIEVETPAGRVGKIKTCSGYEYSTNDSGWRPVAKPSGALNMYRAAIVSLKKIPQFHENPLHLKDIFRSVRDALGKGVNVVMKYGPEALGLIDKGVRIAEGVGSLL